MYIIKRMDANDITFLEPNSPETSNKLADVRVCLFGRDGTRRVGAVDVDLRC